MALLSVLVLLGGCEKHQMTQARQRQHNEAAVANAYAESLRQIGGNHPRFIVYKDAAAVVRRVYRDAESGRQAPIALVVLNRSSWLEEPWYAYAEAAFAEAWRLRLFPITVGASDKTIAALRMVADSGRMRRSRVAAAACLVHVFPAEAKRVLLAEYGNFDVPGMPACGEPFHFPLGTGRLLRGLGMDVPEEVVSAVDMDQLLRSRDRSTRGRRELAGAADILNRKLRALLNKGRMEQLATYASHWEKVKLAQACWEEVLTRPKEGKRTDEGIFDAIPATRPF